MHVGVFLQTALADMEQLWHKKHNSLGTHTNLSDIYSDDLRRMNAISSGIFTIFVV